MYFQFYAPIPTPKKNLFWTFFFKSTFIWKYIYLNVRCGVIDDLECEIGEQSSNSCRVYLQSHTRKYHCLWKVWHYEPSLLQTPHPAMGLPFTFSVASSTAMFFFYFLAGKTGSNRVGLPQNETPAYWGKKTCQPSQSWIEKDKKSVYHVRHLFGENDNKKERIVRYVI